MDCQNCEQKQRQFYCENCLKKHVRDFGLQIHRYAGERDGQISSAQNNLPKLEAQRTSRAEVATCLKRVQELKDGLAKLRKDNEAKQNCLRSLRASLTSRRAQLINARALPSAADQVAPAIASETRELTARSSTIARARSGLVQELVEVFNVVEVGGRPPLGGKAGTKGEWTIGDLVLPVPGDIRRYPPDHINAVITHTVHFLSLLTFYLGIKLPFEISWTGGKLGVGQPMITAGKGGESGSWAKWHTKHPLHLSSSPSRTSASSPSSENFTVPVLSSSLSDSVQALPSSATHSSFTTALAMLLYNVCYLAYTQDVIIPLAGAGDILGNLWAVCCSSELGRKSHQANPRLAPPTPPAFGLDFAQLLQATAAHPRRRERDKGKDRDRRTTRKETPIKEEEDGWDLVDDVGEGFA